MDYIVPALLADLRRPWLWKGSAVGTVLVLGLLTVLAIASGSEAGVSTSDTYSVLLQATLSLVLTVSAVVGSFAFTSDYRAGCFNRRVLLFQRRPAFIGRAATTTGAAVLSGVGIGLAFGVSGAFLGGARSLSLHAVLAFAGTAAMGSLWGFAAGSLIRNHLVSLFVVPLSLVLPEFVLGPSGTTGTYLFPVLAADWANQAAVNIPASWSFIGAAGWVLVSITAALWAFLKRDLA